MWVLSWKSCGPELDLKMLGSHLEFASWLLSHWALLEKNLLSRSNKLLMMSTSVTSRYEGGGATRKIKEHGCISELKSGKREDMIVKDYRLRLQQFICSPYFILHVNDWIEILTVNEDSAIKILNFTSLETKHPSSDSPFPTSHTRPSCIEWKGSVNH